MADRRYLLPRVSLKALLVAVTLIGLAFGWRTLCQRQVVRLTSTEQVLAELDQADENLIDEHIDNADRSEIRVFQPTSGWRKELAVWGVMPVKLVVRSDPRGVRPARNGMKIYDRAHSTFTAQLRPWGLTRLRHASDMVVTEARLARAQPGDTK